MPSRPSPRLKQLPMPARELLHLRPVLREHARRTITFQKNPVTGLQGRGGLARKLEQHLNLHIRYPGARLEKTRPEFTLFRIDARGLKRINDNVSNASGDAYLRGIAGILKEHGFAYHLGGDEFVLMVGHADGNKVRATQASLKRRIARLAQHPDWKDKGIGLHMSRLSYTHKSRVGKGWAPLAEIEAKIRKLKKGRNNTEFRNDFITHIIEYADLLKERKISDRDRKDFENGMALAQLVHAGHLSREGFEKFRQQMAKNVNLKVLDRGFAHEKERLEKAA